MNENKISYWPLLLLIVSILLIHDYFFIEHIIKTPVAITVSVQPIKSEVTVTNYITVNISDFNKHISTVSNGEEFVSDAKKEYIGPGLPYIYTNSSIVSTNIPIPDSSVRIRNIAKELIDVLEGIK